MELNGRSDIEPMFKDIKYRIRVFSNYVEFLNSVKNIDFTTRYDEKTYNFFIRENNEESDNKEYMLNFSIESFTVEELYHNKDPISIAMHQLGYEEGLNNGIKKTAYGIDFDIKPNLETYCTNISNAIQNPLVASKIVENKKEGIKRSIISFKKIFEVLKTAMEDETMPFIETRDNLKRILRTEYD